MFNNYNLIECTILLHKWQIQKRSSAISRSGQVHFRYVERSGKCSRSPMTTVAATAISEAGSNSL